MRDIVLAVVIFGSALAGLKHAWIGAMLWTWISLMNPHVGFGYAIASWPVGLLAAVSTLIGFMVTQERRNPFDSPPMIALLAFVIWLVVMLPLSLYFDQALPLFERSMKIFLMLFITVSLMNSQRKLQVFVWVVVFSLGFYGIKGGLFTIATGGNYRVWGPGGFVEGNNEFALALLTVVPLMRYLQLQMRKRWAVNLMTGWMLLSAVTVLGSYSRGALLGMGAMAAMLWMKGNKKVFWGLCIIGFIVVVLPLMPDAWWDRMSTIRTYQSDDSAQGRFNAWANAWNLAKDKVIFGGGMHIVTREVFAKYAPDPSFWLAAHSIYFQVMGELGFMGLFLFLLIGATTWFTCRSLVAAARLSPEHQWAADLGSMLQVCLVGYGVGGAFLSLAYFDLPYDLAAIAVTARYVVRRDLKAAAEAARAGAERADLATAAAPGRMAT
jgi:probable O-glycosylation ligase (exosortase A-associated)